MGKYSMPRGKRRPFKQGAFYHVYNRGNRKERVFTYASDRDYFIRRLKKLSKAYTIKIVGYCLIDNHFHIVFRQGVEEVISKLMQRLICAYSMHYNRKYNLVGHTFQGRFKSRLIIGHHGLVRLIAYLRKNPVEAEYVRDPEHYKWLFIDKEYESMGDRP